MKKYVLIAIAILFNSFYSFAQPGVKHILLEEFSTAPCGFCPEGDIFAQDIIDNHPEVIWVTHHAGFGTDSMTIPASSAIAGAFTTFAPGACLDRGDYPIPVYTIAPYIAVSRQKWDSIVVAHLNDPPVVDVLISNNYNPTTRKLDVSVDVNFLATPAPGDLRLNLFLVEDSIVGFGNGYDQTNYFNTTQSSPFYNLGDPMVGYVHKHVVRYSHTGSWGVAGSIPNNPVTGNTFTEVFNNIDILNKWKDQDLTIVAFLSYYNNDAHLRQVLNSNEVPLNFSTGIADHAISSAVAVYPNPASDLITFENTLKNEQQLIEVYNSQGQVINTFTMQAHQTKRFSITDMENGVYYYKTHGATGKIVVLH